jgi:amino acid transporter
MEELASAFPISGAPYTYLLSVSSKSLSILGASLLLLDFTATSVVASATAASYLTGEFTMPFPSFVVAICGFFLLAAIGLSGVKESARIALVVLNMHVSIIPSW